MCSLGHCSIDFKEKLPNERNLNDRSCSLYVKNSKRTIIYKMCIQCIHHRDVIAYICKRNWLLPEKQIGGRRPNQVNNTEEAGGSETSPTCGLAPRPVICY